MPGCPDVFLGLSIPSCWEWGRCLPSRALLLLGWSVVKPSHGITGTNPPKELSSTKGAGGLIPLLQPWQAELPPLGTWPWHLAELALPGHCCCALGKGSGGSAQPLAVPTPCGSFPSTPAAPQEQPEAIPGKSVPSGLGAVHG